MLQRALQVQLLRICVKSLLVLILLVKHGLVQVVLTNSRVHQRRGLLLIHLGREKYVVCLALLFGKPLLPHAVLGVS